MKQDINNHPLQIYLLYFDLFVLDKTLDSQQVAQVSG